MKIRSEHIHDPVLSHVRKDFAVLRDNITAQEALDTIRAKGVGEKVVYFYITDESEQLVGVLPTRRLLTIMPDQRICDIMIRNVITIPDTASLFEACEFFARHKFFAFPVVDSSRRIVGMVDVALFTDQVFDIAEREQMNDVFEAIGFRVEQIRGASPARAFKIRFPWLLATIASGTACALLAGVYEATLAQSLAIAFFLTLALGLGESVSIQSMTVATQALHSTPPTLRWYWTSLRREAGTAALLGIACGLIVAVIAGLWQGITTGAVIGGSIIVAIFMACTIGLSVPALLHALKLDFKIAAGPITLAITDISTIFFYFSIGTLFLI